MSCPREEPKDIDWQEHTDKAQKLKACAEGINREIGAHVVEMESRMNRIRLLTKYILNSIRKSSSKRGNHKQWQKNQPKND